MNDDSLDKLLRERIQEQENLYPSRWPSPDSVWRSINERRHYKAKRRKLLWQIAATLLIVVLAGVFFIPGRLRNAVKHDKSPATLSSKEQDALQFITKYCHQKNISCSAPVIQELRGALEESFKKLEEIDDQLLRYGNDAELIRAKARIESHQARLIKTIVQKL